MALRRRLRRLDKAVANVVSVPERTIKGVGFAMTEALR